MQLQTCFKELPFPFLLKAVSDSNNHLDFSIFLVLYTELLFLPMSSSPSINLIMPYNLQSERKEGQQLAFSKWWYVRIRALGGPIYQSDF